MAEAIGLASSVLAVVEASAKVGGAAFKYIRSVRDAPEEISRFTSTLSAHQLIVRTIQRRIDEDPNFEQRMAGLLSGSPDSPIDATLKLLQDMDEELDLTRKAHKKKWKWLGAAGKGKEKEGSGKLARGAQRMAWPFKEKQMKKHIEELEKLKSNLMLALQGDNMVDNQRIIDITEETHDIIKKSAGRKLRKTEDKTRDAFLKSLMVNGLSGQHARYSSRRSHGTGRWLLDRPEVVSWLNGKSNRPIWLAGMHCTGKTHLVSAIVDHIYDIKAESDIEIGLAYFYFTFEEKNPKSHTVDNLLRCLLYQLASQLEYLPQDIQKSFLRWSKDRREPKREETLQSLVSLSSCFDRTFIIIDGLDDCDPPDDLPNERQKLLEVIESLNQEGISMLVSSLPYREDIPRTVTNPIRIPVQAHEDDVSLYIRDEMSQNRRSRDLCLGESDIEDVVYKLTQIADGIFVSVVLNLRFLLSQPTHQSFIDTLRDLENGVSFIESPVQTNYSTTLDRLLRKKQTANLALRALAWVVHANGILTLKQLQTALAIREGDEEINAAAIVDRLTLVDICAGFLIINSTGLQDYVQLIHSTAKDFLLNCQQTPLFEKPHYEIAKTLRTYLTFRDFREGSYGHLLLSMYTPSPSESHLEASLLEYCRASLKWHLDELDNNDARDIFDSILGTERCGILLALLLEDPLAVAETSAFLTSCTPLHIAIMFGSIKVVRSLIMNGADVTATALGGVTPMHMLFSSGFEFQSIINELEGKGAVWWVKDHNGMTPISYLLQSPFRNTAVAGWKRNWVEKFNFPEWYIQYLHSTIQASENNPDFKTWTCVPLSVAVENDDLETVRSLLYRGAIPTAHDNTGCTALDLAFRKFKMLPSMGVSYPDENYTSHNEGFILVSQLCLALLRKAKPEDISGKGYLIAAAYRGNERLVRFLLQKAPANPDLPIAFLLCILCRSSKLATVILETCETSVFSLICRHAWGQCTRDINRDSTSHAPYGFALAEYLYSTIQRGRSRMRRIAYDDIDWQWLGSLGYRFLCANCQNQSINGRIPNSPVGCALHDAVHRAGTIFKSLSPAAQRYTWSKRIGEMMFGRWEASDYVKIRYYERCHKEIIFLLERNVDINRIGKMDNNHGVAKFTATSIAASFFDLSTLKLLVNKGGAHPQIPQQHMMFEMSVPVGSGERSLTKVFVNPLEQFLRSKISEVQDHRVIEDCSFNLESLDCFCGGDSLSMDALQPLPLLPPPAIIPLPSLPPPPTPQVLEIPPTPIVPNGAATNIESQDLSLRNTSSFETTAVDADHPSSYGMIRNGENSNTASMPTQRFETVPEELIQHRGTAVIHGTETVAGTLKSENKILGITTPTSTPSNTTPVPPSTTTTPPITPPWTNRMLIKEGIISYLVITLIAIIKHALNEGPMTTLELFTGITDLGANLSTIVIIMFCVSMSFYLLLYNLSAFGKYKNMVFYFIVLVFGFGVLYARLSCPNAWGEIYAYHSRDSLFTGWY